MYINLFLETLRDIDISGNRVEDIDEFNIEIYGYTNNMLKETYFYGISVRDFNKYEQFLNFEYDSRFPMYIVGWISFKDGGWLERKRGNLDYWEYHKRPKLSPEQISGINDANKN